MTRQPRKNHRSNQPQGDPSLTSAQFHILLTLTQGPKHGYGIMQEVEERTVGALELGPGTLYRSIKQLLERGFIVEVSPGPEESTGSETRRRLYSLTPAGRARTAEEAQRLRELVRWAEDAMVLEGGRA
jgi:DNA-binding PadR family transcriptional regulator